jgi:iron(III) transport system permease protein
VEAPTKTPESQDDPVSESTGGVRGDAPSASSTRQRGGAIPQKVLVFAVGAVLLLLILYPIIRMVARAFFPQSGLELSPFVTTVQQPWFWPVVRNTLVAVLAAAALALVVGSVLAWLNERTDAGLGWFGSFMPLMPLLIPPIAMGAGWVFLASPKIGFLNGLLSHLPGKPSVNVMTMHGLIFVYMLALVPYAYLAMSGALRNIDPALEEASLVSGAGILRTVVRVSLPAVSHALASAFFLMIVVGLALYSVPVVIGTGANIDILSVRIIRSMTFSFPPDIQTATVLASMLLVVILAAWFLQNAVTRRGRFAMISGRSGGGKISLGRWRHVARSLTLLYLVLTSVFPLVGLLLVAFQPFWTPRVDFAHLTVQNFERMLVGHQVAGRALNTSITLGLAGGAIAIAVGMLIGLAQRGNANGRTVGARWGRALDVVAKMPAAFSSIVIGLGFVVAFSGAPFHLEGTRLILLLCYVVIFMPEASIAAGSAMSQIGSDLAEASYISGAREWRTFSRVTLPLAWPGLASGWALVFVLITGELAASTLLASTKTPVIGFVLVDSWESGIVGQMAAFASVVTAITSAAVVILLLLGRQRYRRTR